MTGILATAIISTNVCMALAFGAASGLTVAGLVPYLRAVVPQRRAVTRPLWITVLTRSINAGITMFLLSWIGLRVGASVGLGAPLVRGWINHQLDVPVVRPLLLAAGVGLAVGVFILLLDRFLFAALLPAAILQPSTNIGRWKGLLASFYSAIAEEIQMRLFAMSIIAWILSKALHGPTIGIFVAASVLSALLFAAGHLPLAAKLSPLTAPVVTRVLSLNTLAGIAFGLLFWRYGLESAMLAHFATDFVLHFMADGTPQRAR